MVEKKLVIGHLHWQQIAEGWHYIPADRRKASYRRPRGTLERAIKDAVNVTASDTKMIAEAFNRHCEKF